MHTGEFNSCVESIKSTDLVCFSGTYQVNQIDPSEDKQQIWDREINQ